MKKYFKFLLITYILFTTISCGDKDCNCDPKAHLGIGETCSCGGTGCTCTEQNAIMESTTIPIRKQVGVTVVQMNSAVAVINSSNFEFNQGQINKFILKVTEIRISTGNSISLNNTILIFGCNATEDDYAEYLSSSGIFD